VVQKKLDLDFIVRDGASRESLYSCVCVSKFACLFSILLFRLAFTLALYAVLAVLNALGFCYLFLFCLFTHCAHRRGRAGGGQTGGRRTACWCQ